MERTVTEGPEYRVGDILRVTCPWTPAEVAGVTGRYAVLVWPWAEIDPESRFGWDGRVAVPTDPDSPERWQDVFRTEPKPWLLSAGDTCLVGVPETLVRVLDIDHHDPLADRGWLPRPHTTLVVAHLDQPQEPMWPEEEGEGFTIDPGSFAPLTLELVSRA
ncbi:hypothetical protein HLK59_45685 [Streptomyces sp. S3(2020)]|uniref:hypothetical protein n=1 Tax=Streptomyces sp. S3(2020) TaxID=2732044 RepID=UPI001488B82E|nr:hypothetical protein [Streptomyces sp. S3(2020)]NNN37501.1 hypothetical protein [Streptomyces sp. S3(2020)]